jgi:hypothetical protein
MAKVSKYRTISQVLDRYEGGFATEKELAAAIGRFDLDEDEDGHRLLHDACMNGREKAVDYLLRNGADPSLDGCYGGNALAHAMTTSIPKAAVKKRLVERLLAAGVAVDDAAKREIDEAVVAKKGLADRSYDNDSRRHFKSQLASFLETIPLLLAKNPKLDAATKRKLATLKVPAAKPAARFNAKRVRKLLVKGKADRDSVGDACELLAEPSAIADSEWASLVGAAIAASRSFAEVAEEVYGEPIAFADDEGSLAQGWEEYVVLDLIFELLAREAAAACPAWRELVAAALRARPVYDATDIAEDAVAELFAQPWVKRHAAVGELKKLEKATRAKAR